MVGGAGIRQCEPFGAIPRSTFFLSCVSGYRNSKKGKEKGALRFFGRDAGGSGHGVV
uniref:Uncharacterized protein n=1 Tax=Tetraselmis sp. GSL018 TaxID=582737 RepID=A0A061RQT1_9CHLO